MQLGGITIPLSLINKRVFPALTAFQWRDGWRTGGFGSCDGVFRNIPGFPSVPSPASETDGRKALQEIVMVTSLSHCTLDNDVDGSEESIENCFFFCERAQWEANGFGCTQVVVGIGTTETRIDNYLKFVNPNQQMTVANKMKTQKFEARGSDVLRMRWEANSFQDGSGETHQCDMDYTITADRGEVSGHSSSRNVASIITGAGNTVEQVFPPPFRAPSPPTPLSPPATPPSLFQPLSLWQSVDAADFHSGRPVISMVSESADCGAVFAAVSDGAFPGLSAGRHDEGVGRMYMRRLVVTQTKADCKTERFLNSGHGVPFYEDSSSHNVVEMCSVAEVEKGKCNRSSDGSEFVLFLDATPARQDMVESDVMKKGGTRDYDVHAADATSGKRIKLEQLNKDLGNTDRIRMHLAWSGHECDLQYVVVGNLEGEATEGHIYLPPGNSDSPHDAQSHYTDNALLGGLTHIIYNRRDSSVLTDPRLTRLEKSGRCDALYSQLRSVDENLSNGAKYMGKLAVKEATAPGQCYRISGAEIERLPTATSEVCYKVCEAEQPQHECYQKREVVIPVDGTRAGKDMSGMPVYRWSKQETKFKPLGNLQVKQFYHMGANVSKLVLEETSSGDRCSLLYGILDTSADDDYVILADEGNPMNSDNSMRLTKVGLLPSYLQQATLPSPSRQSCRRELAFHAGSSHGQGEEYVYDRATTLYDGRVVFPPRMADRVGIYDPINDTFTEGPAHGQAKPAYRGATTLYDGRVVFAPYFAENVGIFDPSDESFVIGPRKRIDRGGGDAAYDGAVTLYDGRVVFGPRDAPRIGLFNPHNNTFEKGPAHGHGAFSYKGAVKLHDGRVLFTTVDPPIGIYDPSDDSFISLSETGDLPYLAYSSAATVPDGRVIMAPWGG